MKSTIENLRGLQKITYMDNAGSRILKISLIIAFGLTLAGFGSAQTETVYFQNNQPADGATIKVYSGSQTNVKTSLDIDVSEFKPDTQLRDTWNLYVNGSFEGSIDQFINGSQVITKERTAQGVEIGQTIKWNHVVENTSTGNTFQSQNYTFNVVEGISSGGDISDYENIQNLTLPNSILSTDVSKNYLAVGLTGGSYEIYDRNNFSLISSNTSLSGDIRGIDINENLGVVTLAKGGTDDIFSYDLNNGSLQKTFSGSQNQGYGLDVEVEDGLVVGGIGDLGSGYGYIFDYSTGNELLQTSYAGDGGSVDISQDYILFGNNENYIDVRDKNTYNQITTLPLESSVRSIDSNGEVIIGSTWGSGQVKVFNYSTLSNIYTTTIGYGLGKSDSLTVENDYWAHVNSALVNARGFDSSFSSIKNFTDSNSPITAVASDNQTLVFGGDQQVLYVYENPGLTLSNLRYGIYNYTSGGIDETSSFTEPDKHQSRIDFTGGNSNDCIDLYYRPLNGWDPIPGGFNSTTWTSFSNTNCIGNLGIDTQVVSPIITTGDYPLNQTDTYEIFAGGFIGSEDPTTLSNKSNADLTTPTQTFSVDVEGDQLTADLNLNRPGDNYVYSFQNATNDNIPFEFSISGNKVADVILTIYNTSGDQIVGEGTSYNGADLINGFSDSGSFGVPQTFQIENGSYKVELNVTDGFTTLSTSNNILLQQNPDETDAPLNNDTGTGGGDEPSSQTGFFKQLLTDIIGGFANFFGTLNQIVLNELGSVGATIMGLILSLVFALIALVLIELFIGTGSILAGIGTFGTSIMAFVVGGWIPGWIIVTGTVLVAGVIFWRAYNG